MEKLKNYKAGTEEGIVSEMLKYGGGPSHLGHACWARGDPVDHGDGTRTLACRGHRQHLQEGG